MYLDRVKIFIKAGNGGNGKTSFHTEKYVAMGGPDGGDGGHGGNIVFVADKSIDSLIDFRFTKHFRAENGANGGSTNKRGKNGEDLYIKMPVGVVVKDIKNNKLIAIGTTVTKKLYNPNRYYCSNNQWKHQKHRNNCNSNKNNY